MNVEKNMMGSTMKKLNSSNETHVNIGISNSKNQSPVLKIGAKEKMAMAAAAGSLQQSLRINQQVRE